MPFFIFAPILIAIEVVEVVQVAVGVTAAVGAGYVAARATQATVETVQELTRTPHPILTVEKKTIWDWWCNGLDNDERKILLEHGYNDRDGCFTLEELKSASERMYAEKAPGKPTEKDGFTPDRHKGDKPVKNPNGQGKGWLDKKGEVWVPTGNDGHGGAHWDVQNPRTGVHRDVYPGGRTRHH